MNRVDNVANQLLTAISTIKKLMQKITCPDDNDTPNGKMASPVLMTYGRIKNPVAANTIF